MSRDLSATATTLLDEPADAPLAGSDASDLIRAAVEWLPVGVTVVSGSGVIVVANRETERLFGYPASELIGQSVDVLVPDSARARHAALRQLFSEQPRARPMNAGRELFGRRKDGSEIPLEIGLTPITIHGSPFVLTSILDLSERRSTAAPGSSAALDDPLEFERLIGELGAEFVNLRPEEVDRAIEDSLGRLVRTLGLDRSALFQVDEGGDFVHTHHWTRPGWAPPVHRVSARERFPWHLAQVRAGDLVTFSSVDDVPDPVDRENLRHSGTRSAVTVPLMVGGQAWGALTFAAVREGRTWTPAVINRFRVVALIFANALARKVADERLRNAVAELTALRNRLRDENQYLRDELKTLVGTPAIVGHSPAMRRVLEQVRQVAPTNSPVLLLGETGTGKALLAARIHELSPRSEHPMVRVNCASVSAEWIDGVLLGSDHSPRAGSEPGPGGRRALASGSTVFFDEIADLPLEAQASLMRLLQQRQAQTPAGTPPSAGVDVRIIASTRKDLKRCIEEGTFRDDLYYRLNVFPIRLPSLRERREDIPLLVWRFVDEFSETHRKPIESIDQESMNALHAYPWRGNARELRNVVERAMMVATGRRLTIATPANGSVRAHKRRETALHTTPSSVARFDGRPHGNGHAAPANGSKRQSTRTRRIAARADRG